MKIRLQLTHVLLLCAALVPSRLWAEPTLGEGGEFIVGDEVVVMEFPSPEGTRPLLAVGSPNGHHFLYDPNEFRVRGVWSGGFVRKSGEADLQVIGELHDLGIHPSPLRNHRFRGIPLEWDDYQNDGNTVTFTYRAKDGEVGYQIQEEVSMPDLKTVVLDFKFKPDRTPKTILSYRLEQRQHEEVETTGSVTMQNTVLRLLPDQRDYQITLHLKDASIVKPAGYTAQLIPSPETPAPFLFEPSCLDFAPDGSLYVGTRSAGVWRYHNGTWSLFADGLHEVLGVRVAPDGRGIIVTQKPELTRLVDTDGDGVADLYEAMEYGFRFTGQYHEFAYGPATDVDGNHYISTNLSSGGHNQATPSVESNQMTSALGYRGWVLKRPPEGGLIPFANGLRSPAGIGTNARGELFITDNQGDWIPSSYLIHLEQGDFAGHPASLWDLPEYGLTETLTYKTLDSWPREVPKLDQEAFSQKRKKPSVWLVHQELASSPGNPAFAPEDTYGPFGGQAFIGDISQRSVIRVHLEKVGGQYQGSAYPFYQPLEGPAFATEFGPDGNLWVSAVGRGWIGGRAGLEVIRWDKKTMPFEIHHISLTKKGFELHFTKPLSNESISSSQIHMESWNYLYWGGYGSQKMNKATPTASELSLSEDRRVLSFTTSLTADRVYKIRLAGIASASGDSLGADTGYYTLNQLR